MKKYIFLIVILLISILTIFSCRKSFDPQLIQDQIKNRANETEMKIQSFLDGTNNNIKSGSTYTIEQAIWYAEASLNFSYAIYDSSFIYLSRETSSFSINLNQSNTVNQSDLLAAYAKMVDSLEAHYNAVQDSPKHVFLCDIIDVHHSATTVDLVMVSVIACGFTYNLYGSFNETDYWYAGGGAGKCDDYEDPIYIGRDATTELEYKLLHPYIAPVQNMRMYYTDIETVWNVDPIDYPYTNSPRGCRGYVYGSNIPDDIMQCLPPSELNFYISNNGIPYMIDDNNTFIDKEFCYIDIRYDFLPSIWLYYEQHFYDIGYGIRQSTTITTVEF